MAVKEMLMDGTKAKEVAKKVGGTKVKEVVVMEVDGTKEVDGIKAKEVVRWMGSRPRR